jgi:hypothetical protein
MRCKVLLFWSRNYQNECHTLRDLGGAKKEVIMRKIILAFIGVALMAGATTGAAYSKHRHHVRAGHYYHYYYGEAGAWGSMTGFN